jgi:hypothetical protein
VVPLSFESLQCFPCLGLCDLYGNREFVTVKAWRARSICAWGRILTGVSAVSGVQWR